jgi:hypothetical protein
MQCVDVVGDHGVTAPAKMPTHHLQIPQRTHYIVVITPASPTSCQGSPGTSALNCGRLIVSVPSMF